MSTSNGLRTPTVRVGHHVLALMVAWVAAIAASLTWNLFQVREGTLEAARVQARMDCEKNEFYRRWNAARGGVHFPTTKCSPSDPNLTAMRPLVARSSAGQLPRITTTYMARQVRGLAEQGGQTRAHLTSLKPIRSANAPDPWETEALKAFERGQTEVSSVERIDGQAYLRVMRPIRSEKVCLNCHEPQGDEPERIRGGLSISIPMAPVWRAAQGYILVLWLGHGLICLLGLGGIGLGWRAVRRRLGERLRAEEALRRQRGNLEALFAAVPVGVLLVDENAVVKNINDVVAKLVGKDATEMINTRPGEGLGCIHASDDPEGCGYGPACSSCPIRCTFERVLSSGEPVDGTEIQHTFLVDGNEVSLWLEITAEPVFFDGSRHVVLAVTNITERKQAEEQLKKSMAELERFNRVAVGREHRMIELKREVNEMARKAGVAPPYDLTFAEEVVAGNDDAHYRVS